MAQIIRRVGPCRFTLRQPTFETLARSIAFQQLSGKAARTIFERLRKAVGRRFTASAFLKLTPEQLRACGLSKQKIASLQDLASRVARREINFRKLPHLPDDEIIAILSQVRGVGVWTAQMFLIFALERPNVMPLEDLGIRNAVRRAYGLEQLPKPAELSKFAEKWHPYCSIASWYLWRSLDGPAGI
ncbi:MAG: DNA-3-methyladenine glycosylase 2 family protein [Acidobacteriaceae bacterium]|nr:DNA-3-methyladenine glycosylase 2 family protein [Acidobacteriaceae bacterium]MBV9781304.1 DNA-3-methyladenine glycosylase 2 family protein [Acidobacteriaceae bacterium]